jgi:hypothetical protein
MKAQLFRGDWFYSITKGNVTFIGVAKMGSIARLRAMILAQLVNLP